jgi:pimeloyl-ACP methyl ester carboxylesterase
LPWVTFETRRVVGSGGVELAVHHLGGDGPPLMAVHATGFHGRCWWPLASVLVPHFSVWAIDLRGHGASDKDPSGTYDWSRFAADLLAAVDAIGGSGWTAIGHSLGGGVIMLAESARPGTFTAAACYEPVVMPPAGVPTRGNPLADLARRRRASFASRAAALKNYRSKPPFAHFDPVTLQMYVEYGLVDAPDGRVTLACRREDEAATFEEALKAPVWNSLPAVAPPVTVMAGAVGEDPLGRIASEVAERLPQGRIQRFEHLDHFGPMTAPAEVGRAMAEALL